VALAGDHTKLRMLASQFIEDFVASCGFPTTFGSVPTICCSRRIGASGGRAARAAAPAEARARKA
jgi:hypothetical protein